MERKHINRRKKYDPDGFTDFQSIDKTNDEWSDFETPLGEKIQSEEIFDVPDRAITFDRNQFVDSKEKEFNDRAVEFKDDFTNTAQYLKFINAHLAEKKNHLDKVISDKQRLSDEISALNPELLTKEQLDNKNYTKLKSEDVKKVLASVEEEKDLLKDKIDHFTFQMNKAQKELVTKNNQVDKIKSELVQESIEEQEPLEIISEDQSIKDVENELKSFASKNESDKIFGAINSLVVLLNSKNQATLNELNVVKDEFNKMKQEYNKVMKDFQKKKNKK